MVPLRFVSQIARLQRGLLKSRGNPAKVSPANIPLLAGGGKLSIFFVNTSQLDDLRQSLLTAYERGERPVSPSAKRIMVTGCPIGGVSVNGGVGKISGILIGVLVFELLKIALQFMGVESSYTYIAQGLVIIVAVALDLRKYLARK